MQETERQPLVYMTASPELSATKQRGVSGTINVARLEWNFDHVDEAVTVCRHILLIHKSRRKWT